MSLVAVLHDLVCKEARISPTGENELHLKELDPLATLKKVIVAMKEEHQAACVALDFRFTVKSKRTSCLSEVLNPDSNHPLRSACDALLCIEKGDVCHLIHIELKSGDKNGAIAQLRNSRCFSRLLRELAREWHEIRPLTYHEWFVLLTSGRKTAARKRKTAISTLSCPPMERPSADPNRPATFSIEDGARIHVGKFYRP